MSLKRLEGLSEKDPEELVLDILNNLECIQTLINRPAHCDDEIVLVIKLLRKAIDTSFLEAKHKVLQSIFNKTFVDNLKKFITYLSLQSAEDRNKSVHFWKEPDQFWRNVVDICQYALDAIPTFATNSLPPIISSLKVYIDPFQSRHDLTVPEQIKIDVENLDAIISEKVRDIMEKHRIQKEKFGSSDQDNEEPPDDFRQITVYPTALEIMSGRRFLRPNIIKGPYKDVNHYLDVQFRLLREDFVAPLRKGIQMFRSLEVQKRLDNVTVHKGVRFIKPESVNAQYCFRVKFSNRKQSFENSQRFMFGSLLVFTNNNFESLIFGKVVQCKKNDFKNGELIVGFGEQRPILYNTDYLMVECSVYFEPYYHVLSNLQLITEKDFPMKRYLIDVNNEVGPPQYGKLHYSKNINAVNTNCHNFNESQLRAFEAATNQEFVIIQGPPGTGKTYLGLEIAKNLLKDYQSWYKDTPMLVVCYTNHALDQFLEGILPITEELIRVGGQSKTENLRKYNLRAKNPLFTYCYRELVHREKMDVEEALFHLKDNEKRLKCANDYKSINRFDDFMKVVPELRSSWFFHADNKDIVSWLLMEKENVVFDEDTNLITGPEEAQVCIISVMSVYYKIFQIIYFCSGE